MTGGGRRRLRKPGADRARGVRGSGAARQRRQTPHSQGCARRPDPTGQRRRFERRQAGRTDARPAIQAKAEEVLAEVGDTYSPKNASAVVMDTRTSQVLAMANWPPVDLDDLEDASSEYLLNSGPRTPTSRVRPSRRSRSPRRSKNSRSPRRAASRCPFHPGLRPHDRRRSRAGPKPSASATSSPSPRTSAR